MPPFTGIESKYSLGSEMMRFTVSIKAFTRPPVPCSHGVPVKSGLPHTGQ
jgi:hypothetical protein